MLTRQENAALNTAVTDKTKATTSVVTVEISSLSASPGYMSFSSVFSWGNIMHGQGQDKTTERNVYSQYYN